MYELRIVRERRHGYGAVRRIRDAAQVYEAFRQDFTQLDHEMFVVVRLDGRNGIIGFNRVSVGSLTAALVHPREVFKPAILANAAAIVLLHNHPSGPAGPSAEDMAVIARLRQVGELIGIRVLDHVVCGSDGYVSMAEREGW
jgi:DNA repair protein RadC